MGRWLKHCGYYPSWNLRLIKKGHGEYEKISDTGIPRAGTMKCMSMCWRGPVGLAQGRHDSLRVSDH